MRTLDEAEMRLASGAWHWSLPFPPLPPIAVPPSGAHSPVGSPTPLPYPWFPRPVPLAW